MNVLRIMLCTACASALLGCSHNAQAAAPQRVTIGNGSGYLRYGDAQAALKFTSPDIASLAPVFCGFMWELFGEEDDGFPRNLFRGRVFNRV